MLKNPDKAFLSLLKPRIRGLLVTKSQPIHKKVILLVSRSRKSQCGSGAADEIMEACNDLRTQLYHEAWLWHTGEKAVRWWRTQEGWLQCLEDVFFREAFASQSRVPQHHGHVTCWIFFFTSEVWVASLRDLRQNNYFIKTRLPVHKYATFQS